ncbi:MAG: RNA-binding protein [Burkholderiales bacterium PBB5]|nr:MAG: RNA-binding protein [Burkholderiales bacterium PBB5]
MHKLQFELRGEFITLDRLLKATGLAPSGATAKALVADGRVQVDGRDEARKTAKIRAGQVVAVQGTRITVLAAAADTAPAEGPSAAEQSAAEQPAATPPA